MVGEDANDLKDERYPNGQEDQVCCAGHVMMAELVNLNMIRLNILYFTSWAPAGVPLYLEEHKDGDAIHKGGVKLEVSLCGTNMVAATQNTWLMIYAIGI